MLPSILSTATVQRITSLSPASLVVGIPSYRNPDTIQQVATQVATCLSRHYATLDPVIVHVDGHSFDNTLDLAAALPLPAGVRRVTTRYQGLPGKGSAVRCCFEVAAHLNADVVAVVEADTISFDTAQLRALLAPVIEGRATVAYPRYAAVSPRRAIAALLLNPLADALFGVAVHDPTAGEVAMRMEAARFLLACDVWESDVARAGLDIWMAARLAIAGETVEEVRLPAKKHRAASGPASADAKAVQAVGTLFRMAYLHEQAWTTRECAASPASAPTDPRFESWANTVFSALIEYNFGDSDPDRVVSQLYHDFTALLADVETTVQRAASPDAAWDEQSDACRRAFQQRRPALLAAWHRFEHLS